MSSEYLKSGSLKRGRFLLEERQIIRFQPAKVGHRPSFRGRQSGTAKFSCTTQSGAKVKVRDLADFLGKSVVYERKVLKELTARGLAEQKGVSVKDPHQYYTIPRQYGKIMNCRTESY